MYNLYSFFSRLFVVSSEAHRRLGPVFVDCCRERIGMRGDALALAMRIVCCNSEGLDATVDLVTLRALQEVDGGWADGWFYKYGSNGVRIANRGLTTAVAINAIVSAGGQELGLSRRERPSQDLRSLNLSHLQSSL